MTTQLAKPTSPAYKTCSVPRCDRKHKAKELCDTHYMREYRHGNPRADMPIVTRNQDPPGTCTVPGCDRRHFGRGLCTPHWQRDRAGDVRPDDPIVTYRPDDPTYFAVHKRLYSQRGRADEHTCVDCGSRAEEWAYSGGCPDEKLCETQGSPYSTNLDRYEPRCISCHIQFDLNA